MIQNYGEWSLDRNSLDRNCVISVDQNFHNQLTEFFETFQLIKKFNQRSVDRKFKITQNDINKNFDQLKRSSEIRSTDKKKSFNQTPYLTETFDQLKMSSEIRSTDPLSKITFVFESIILTFDVQENLLIIYDLKYKFRCLINNNC